MIAYPVMVLAALGVVLCLSFYLLELSGIYALPTNRQPVLFVGIFVVWFPTVIFNEPTDEGLQTTRHLEGSLEGMPGMDEESLVGHARMCDGALLRFGYTQWQPMANIRSISNNVLFGFFLHNVFANSRREL